MVRGWGEMGLDEGDAFTAASMCLRDRGPFTLNINDEMGLYLH
jgi:hypothetical protein